MKNKKTYIILTEINDWEGETWNFYIPITENNKKARDIISNIIVKNHLGFELSEVSLTGDQIKELPDTTGYMATHNILDGELDIKKLQKIKKYDDEFYKGQINNFIIQDTSKK